MNSLPSNDNKNSSDESHEEDNYRGVNFSEKGPLFKINYDETKMFTIIEKLNL